MNASEMMTADRIRQASEKYQPSTLSRLPSTLGWLLVAVGAVTDAIYHLPILLFGFQWSPVIAAIGEFGHTVIFVGVVMVIFAALRKHQRTHP